MDEKTDKPIAVSKLDFSFREEIASQPGGENVKRCFACGTCAAGCPITDIDEKYNSRTIIRQILFGMRQEVLSSPTIWLCLICYRCYTRCPQKVNFTDIMRILRYLAVKGHHVSQETQSRVSELDRLSQEVRHDFIDHLFNHDKQLAEKVKSKIKEKLNV